MIYEPVLDIVESFTAFLAMTRNIQAIIFQCIWRILEMDCLEVVLISVASCETSSVMAVI